METDNSRPQCQNWQSVWQLCGKVQFGQYGQSGNSLFGGEKAQLEQRQETGQRQTMT